MARVEIGAQGWGWIADTSGDAQVGAAVQITDLSNNPATVWSDVTGGTPITPLITNALGVIPGFIDEGVYKMTAFGVTREVEAVSGTIDSRMDLVESRLGLDSAALLQNASAVRNLNNEAWV